MAARLWTPIANALETYRRRLLSDPSARYEHVWRLIQIEEACVVMLGSALASCCLDAWGDKPSAASDHEQLRRRLLGDKTSCLTGSINAWIQLLGWFAKRDEQDHDPEFVKAAKRYLSTDRLDPDSESSPLIGKLCFLSAWSRIGDPGSTYAEDNLPRYQRLQAINQVRNKLAHTPIPYDVIKLLCADLRTEMVLHLSPESRLLRSGPTDDLLSRQWMTVMTGWIDSDRISLTGSEFSAASVPNTSGNPRFRWSSGKTGNTWNASPFMSVNDDGKARLLFRITPEQLFELRDSTPSDELEVSGEFYRFAAESDPSVTITIPASAAANLVARPAPQPIPDSETPKHKGEPESAALKPQLSEMDPQELRDHAEDAFRQSNWESALATFDALASTGDQYKYNDVAKSKHGGALWRVANRLEDQDAREEVLERARRLLSEAAGHRDPGYRARAKYERSKASNHLWSLNQDPEMLDEAIRDAEEAAKLAYDDSYISWYERLRQARNASAHGEELVAEGTE